MFSLKADFWELFALGMVGVVVLSIVIAALWTYIFKDH